MNHQGTPPTPLTSIHTFWLYLDASPTNSWENPIDYTNIVDADLLNDFAWDGSEQPGSATLEDGYNNQTYNISYKYRRFRLYGASGVFMFPTNPDLSTDEPIHVLIENTATGSDLHTDFYPTPVPAAIGKIALSGISSRSEETHRFVVVRLSGGPGPQALLSRLQHTLLARRAIEIKIAVDYEFEPQRYFLTGGSFGTAPTYLLQLVHPDLFHGAAGSGSSAVCTQALFGYESFFKFGINAAGERSGSGGNDSTISASGQWYYDQMTKVLKAHAASQTSGTGGLENMSLLGRLVHRLNGGSWTGPIMTRPIFVFGGDEDSTAWLHPFRNEFDAILSATVGTGTYSDFLKICQIPFLEHVIGEEPETVHLHPSVYLPSSSLGVPSGYTTVDWLVERSVYVDTLGFTQASHPWDDGVPEPNGVDDYRFHEAALATPPENPTNNSLNITSLWPDGGSGEGYVGTGIEPGLCDNLFVGQLDEDSNLELMYGEGSGFVHIYEIQSDGEGGWDIVPVWRSPDFGGAVTGLSVGEFAKPSGQGGGSEIGAVAITTAGQVWTIRTSLSTPVAYHLSNWDFALGGERETPLVEVGEYSDSTTVVYFIGTSYKPRSSTPPTDDLPNDCQLSRVVFGDLTQLSSSATLYQEPCDALNSLEWTGDELLATTSRGHLFIIEDGGTDFTMSTRNNFNFGDYQLMAPRVCLPVFNDNYYLLAGQATDELGGLTYNPPLRNVVAIAANGDLVATAKAISHFPPDPDTTNVNFFCGAVIASDEDTYRVALGGDAVYFYDVDASLGSGVINLNQVAVTSSVADAWSPRLHADSTGEDSFPHLAENVLSLESFDINQGQGEADTYLAGTIARGIVFLWDVPESATGTLAQKPTVVAQLQPFMGNFGLQARDRAVPSTNGHSCDSTKKYTLNVLPVFSYNPDFDEEVSFVGFKREENGTVYYKLDALTGEILCSRQREFLARKFNPDPRDFSGSLDPSEQLVSDVFTNNTASVLLDTHVFIETVDVGELVTSGQYDLAFRLSSMDGKAYFRLDYLASGQQNIGVPASGTFMQSDRYFTASQEWGNAVAIGDITSDAGDEIVLSTNGGRFVILNESGELVKGWGSDPSLRTGDYGFKYTGLAVFDVDDDDYDEIFAVGAEYTDPSGGQAGDNLSRILFFDSDGGTSFLQSPQQIAMAEPGCMGLWVGPRLGECPGLGNIDLIVGKSQTFEVREVSMNGNNVDLDTIRFESAGLGAVPGAFNSIEVMKFQQNQKAYHGIWIGTTGYVYGFQTPSWVCGLQH
ncbi:MAG: hypothetical protein RL885_31085 [Planctomycetota bacterium]